MEKVDIREEAKQRLSRQPGARVPNTAASAWFVHLRSAGEVGSMPDPHTNGDLTHPGSRQA